MAEEPETSQPAAPPFSRTKLLQSTNDELSYSVSKICFQFAVLGYTSVALRLLSRLNEHALYSGHYTTVRPLWLLWDVLEEWPVGEQERVREEIISERRKKNKNEKSDGEENDGKRRKVELNVETEVTDQEVRAYIEGLAQRYSKGWHWGKQSIGGISSRRQQPDVGSFERDLSPAEAKQAIDIVWKAIDESFVPDFRDASTGSPAMDVSSALTAALDLSIILGGTNETGTGAVLERIATRMDANQAIQYLAESRRAWTILKDGALAKTLKLDKGKIDNFAREIEGLVYERLQNGRREMEDMTMKEVLDMVDHNTRHGTEAQESFAERGNPIPDTLFHDPATQNQIDETEKRLGIELPSDYKEFLRITNGLDAAFGGIIFEPPLFPVENIRWFTDDEDYFTDLTINIPDELWQKVPREYDHDDIHDWPTVGKAIEIGTEDIDNVWLIPPSKVKELQERVTDILKDDSEHPEHVRAVVKKSCEDFAGSMEKWDALEWCCVTWAAGGSACMLGYPSLKAYLRKVGEESGKSEVDVFQDRKFLGYYCRMDSSST